MDLIGGENSVGSQKLPETVVSWKRRFLESIATQQPSKWPEERVRRETRRHEYSIPAGERKVPSSMRATTISMRRKAGDASA